MSTKLYTFSLLTVVTLLAGCSWGQTPSLSSMTTGEKYDAMIATTGNIIGVSACDSYNTIITCMATNTTGDMRDAYTAMYYTQQSTRSGMQATQLDATCTSLLTEARKESDKIRTAGCEIK